MSQQEKLEQFEELKKNIVRLCGDINSESHGVSSKAALSGVKFGVKSILQGTGLSMDELKAEAERKGWLTETSRP